MILHIPHSSRIIPDDLRGQIVLSDEDLSLELTLMTDLFTDELFAYPGTATVTFPISRLLVDVERFPNDADEPMAAVGMGVIYTKTSFGQKLKRNLLSEERVLLTRYYETHHKALLNEVKTEIDKTGKALIVDCHSFHSQPLPCDNNQTISRPDFCVGTDSFHTPKELVQLLIGHLKRNGYSVQIDRPYAGALVPMEFYLKDSRVSSIMIEVNRILYMDELTGGKASGFFQTKEQIRGILKVISEFQQ